MRFNFGYTISFIAIISPGIVLADKASDEDMSRSAIMSTILSSDQNIINEEIQNSRNSIKTRAQSAREGEIFSATVVFSTGISADELEEFSFKYELEISRAEAKSAVGDDGNILTISIGSRDILMPEGTLSDKLRKASGAQQLMIADQLISDPSDENQELLDAAYQPELKYYKVEIVSGLPSISSLLDDPEVSLIILDSHDRKVQSYYARKSTVSELKRNSQRGVITRRYVDGPPPGIPLDRIRMSRPLNNLQDLVIDSQNGGAR